MSQLQVESYLVSFCVAFHGRVQWAINSFGFDIKIEFHFSGFQTLLETLMMIITVKNGSVLCCLFGTFCDCQTVCHLPNFIILFATLSCTHRPILNFFWKVNSELVFDLYSIHLCNLVLSSLFHLRLRFLWRYTQRSSRRLFEVMLLSSHTENCSLFSLLFLQAYNFL